VVFEKYTSRISKNYIIFAHSYRHSKGTVLEKNILYFELDKKTNFYKSLSLYTIINLCFSIVQNTMQFLEFQMKKMKKCHGFM
jgi:hypothetical protein